MSAALIVVKGEGAGRRLPLDAAVTPLARHCVVRRGGGLFTLVDSGSPATTTVNGLCVSQHALQNGDQIALGPSLLLFDLGLAPVEAGARTTLLRASTLLYLFRALGAASDPDQHSRIETQILRLVSDLTGALPGSLVLSRDEEELRRLEAEALAAGLTSVSLYARGSREGLLTMRFAGQGGADDHAEALGAIAALAAAALESARELESLQTRNLLLEDRLLRLEPYPTGIIGSSPSITRLLELASRVAPQETTVLILGESGTGKELAARAIHQQSRRAAGPFVAINCAAITETLLESELFGHEKGAFTGAVVQKKGKLELAEGGSVFLDEIGELALSLQAKLLRVLQQREFERVGGTRTYRLDVRLIAATNRDLAQQVRAGAFRDDLYHRLNVISLLMPPLRERGADIPILARHFLLSAVERCGRRVLGLSPEAEQLLSSYNWPGNIRELENAIERAVVLGVSEVILPEDLPETVRAVQSSDGGLSGAKRDAIIRAWRQGNGDYKAAAELLGLHPNSLLRLIRNLGLRNELNP
jgi:transcriptional regulator with GAF, ATPase, and Fis domain